MGHSLNKDFFPIVIGTASCIVDEKGQDDVTLSAAVVAQQHGRMFRSWLGGDVQIRADNRSRKFL